jgi:hypothetical protein
LFVCRYHVQYGAWLPKNRSIRHLRLWMTMNRLYCIR